MDISTLHHINFFRKWSILAILSIFSFTQTFANYNINGRIVSNLNSMPIAGVNCKLTYFIAGEKGMNEMVSDNEGVFSFNVPEHATCEINISMNGLSDFKVIVENIDRDVAIGDCILSSVSDLDELVVEAQTHRMNNNKLFITPSSSAVKASNRATDLLAKLDVPGLIYNPIDNTISVNHENPVWLVDGIPSEINTIRALKASDILTVEYSDIVPLNLQSRGNYLINIILKKRTDGGQIIVDARGDVTGSALDPAIYLDYHWGSSKITAQYSLSYRHNDKTYDTQTADYLNPEMQIRTKEDLFSPFLYRMHFANINYTYIPDETLTFSATGYLMASNALRKSYGETYDSRVGNYMTDIRNHTSSLSPQLDLFFSKQFGAKDLLQINIVGRYNDDDYFLKSSYRGDHIDEDFFVNTLGKRYSMMSSAFYTHHFGERTRLSVTYENLISRNTNYYRATQTSYLLTENNNYIYARLEQRLGHLMLTATSGVRFDYINDGGIIKSFTNNQSAITAQWYINPKFSMGAGVDYTPQIFSPRLLIDVPQQISVYLITTGNPNLKRAHTLSQYFNANFNTQSHGINYSLSYHFDHKSMYNPILHQTEYDKNLKLYINRPVNGHMWAQYSTYLNGGISNILGMFGVHGMLQYAHYKINDGSWQKSYNNLSGNFYVTWQYGKWVVMYQRSFPFKSLNEYTFATSESFDAIGVGFRPDNHWNFQLSWGYMFSKKGWEYDATTYSSQYSAVRHREIHNNCNWIRLSISYDLSFGKIFNSRGSTRMLNRKDNDSMVTKFNI